MTKLWKKSSNFSHTSHIGWLEREREPASRKASKPLAFGLGRRWPNAAGAITPAQKTAPTMRTINEWQWLIEWNDGHWNNYRFSGYPNLKNCISGWLLSCCSSAICFSSMCLGNECAHTRTHRGTSNYLIIAPVRIVRTSQWKWRCFIFLHKWTARTRNEKEMDFISKWIQTVHWAHSAKFAWRCAFETNIKKRKKKNRFDVNEQNQPRLWFIRTIIRKPKRMCGVKRRQEHIKTGRWMIMAPK